MFPDTTRYMKRGSQARQFSLYSSNSAWILHVSLSHFLIVAQEYGSTAVLCQDKRDIFPVSFEVQTILSSNVTSIFWKKGSYEFTESIT